MSLYSRTEAEQYDSIKRISLGVVGECRVGKTHFIRRYLFGGESKRIEPTVAIEFYEKERVVEGQTLQLRIWDSSGEEKYKPIVPYHMKSCKAIILMYDLTNRASFDQLEVWMRRLEKQKINLNEKKILIVGNKLDLVLGQPESRKVNYHQVKQLLLKLEVDMFDIFEVSSREESYINNIREIMDGTLMEIIQQQEKEELKIQCKELGVLSTEQNEQKLSKTTSYCGECLIY